VLNQVNAGSQLGAGGGGASSCVVYSGPVIDSGGVPVAADCHGGRAKPVWQMGFGNDTVRDVPDVSLFASSGSNYSFTAACVFTGDCAVPNSGPNSAASPLQVTAIGGTSVAAPTMAGIMALVVEKAQTRQGQANTILYPLSQQAPEAFHDVSVGTNTVECVAGTPNCAANGFLSGYSATVGYDLATGLGSVDAAQLVANWMLITLKPSATTLTINPTTAAHGTSLTFTVNVTGGAIAGDISLLTSRAGAQGQYTTTCAAFPCTFTYAALPGGSYSVSARFAGDGTYAASTSAGVPVTITPENSQLAVYYQIGDTGNGMGTGAPTQVMSLNGQTLIYGGIVSFTAVPVPANTALPADPTVIKSTPATGTITVSDNGVQVGTTLGLDATGRATFEDFNLPVGPHSLTAVYSGDASYNPSSTISPVATPMVFTIGRTYTTMELGPIDQEVPTGSPGFVTAYLPSQAQAAPTGTVTFVITSAAGAVTTLPPAALANVNGLSMVTATVPASALALGDNTCTASYSGDTNYYPLASGRGYCTLHVLTLSTSISFVSTPVVGVAGQPVTLTATINRNDNLLPVGYPMGTVTMTDGSTPLGTFPVVQSGGTGVVTEVTSSLVVGTHQLTATYGGDAGDTGSSASLALVVLAPAPDFTITATPITFSSGEDNASAKSTLTLTLNYPRGAASVIQLTCAAPANAPTISCAAPLPATLAAGSTSTSATVTVAVAGQTSHVAPPMAERQVAVLALSAVLLLPWGFTRGSRRRHSAIYRLILLAMVAAGVSACGSSIYSPIPSVPGTYTVTVTGSLGGTVHQVAIPVVIQ
jgi:hypothetical protein